MIRATDGFELRPDLVLMDVNLPGSDGIEASRRIRSERGEVVVFLLSTYDPAEFQSRMGRPGASTFIPKVLLGPVSLVDAWQKLAG